MLKMIKYELTGSWRQFALGFGVYLLACVCVPLIPNSFIKDAVIIGFSTLMMGLMLALFYTIIAYYQRSMFKRQGYLTLTLPVSEEVLVLSKLISTLIWFSIGMLVLMIGLFIFSIEMGQFSLQIDIKMFLQEIGEYFSLHILDCLSVFLQIILDVASMVLSFYFVITLVHTHWIKRHRTIVGIGIYVIGIIVFASCLEAVPSLESLMNQDWFNIVWFMTEIALFYSGTVYLLKKHIELE